MSRKITVRNPDHPKTKMKDAGEAVRKSMAKLSNAELTEFIAASCPDPDTRAAVLALPRAKRIAYIKRAVEGQWALEYTEAQKQQELAELAKDCKVAAVKRQLDHNRRAEQAECERGLMLVDERDARMRADRYAVAAGVGLVLLWVLILVLG